jgi:hypothetical protein
MLVKLGESHVGDTLNGTHRRQLLGKLLLTTLAKPVGRGAAYQPWILAGEQSGLPMRIAATGSVSSPDERRNLNELAFESDRRESDKRNLLPFQFNSRSLIGKR